MVSVRRFLNELRHTSHSRDAARAHLKAAKAFNDREQYLALASRYIDLAGVFYGSSFPEPAASRAYRVSRLFLGLWQNLRYAERLSDFECMLARTLIDSASESSTIISKYPLVVKLRMLPPETRFALLAYEFEKWPLRWIALVLRTRGPALHRTLSQARCELCGVSWESLTVEEQACLEAVSISLDRCPDIRANRQLNQRVREYPRIVDIKAQWLELRPGLVEVRHRYILEGKAREGLLGEILLATSDAAMERPALVDKMVNSVHFSRHSKIRVS